MNRHAVIHDGVVANIIVWDGSTVWNDPDCDVLVPLEKDEWCSSGATYEPGSQPRFTMPPQPKSWTAYQFLSRFTPAELDAVRVRSQTDPAMWRFLTFASAAQEIVSDDPVTIQGMDYLVYHGIISTLRKNEIMGIQV